MSLDLVPTTLRRSWIHSALISIVGIGLAVELTLIHARVHANPTTRSFCTISEHVSCDKTVQSAFATFAGVPLSIWGLFAYISLLLLALWGWRSRKVIGLALLAAVSVLCATTGLALALLSLWLRNLCILCLASWIVDWSLLVVALRMVRRVGFPRLLSEVRYLWQMRRPWLLGAAIGAIFGVLGLRHVTRKTWGKAAPQEAFANRSLLDRSHADADAKISQGMDDAGHPYMGAVQPKLTILEFADYQCPHCAHAHSEMRDLLAKHPNEIRLVHRHFPLDHQCNSLVNRPFHTHACEYAKLAACAAMAGKFWPANDWLFEHGRDEVPVTSTALAQQLNLDPGQLKECVEKSGAELIKGDIEEGLRNNIQGTPTFVIDGKVYPGRVPDELVDAYQ